MSDVYAAFMMSGDEAASIARQAAEQALQEVSASREDVFRVADIVASAVWEFASNLALMHGAD